MKACPFCKSTNIKNKSKYVTCLDCGARGPLSTDMMITDYIDTRNAELLWDSAKR